MQFFIILLISGCFAGLLSGMLGIGGGIIFSVFFSYLVKKPLWLDFGTGTTLVNATFDYIMSCINNYGKNTWFTA